jgi:hypothetical protein
VRRILVSLLSGVLVSTTSLIGFVQPADAKTQTTYYYFYDSESPKGPVGDNFIVMRVSGEKVAGIYSTWGSEGSWFTGSFSGSKVKFNYKYQECKGGTSTRSSYVTRTGTKTSVQIKGFKQGLKTTSIATLDKKYVSLAKEMYQDDSHSWITKVYFSKMFTDAKKSNWVNGGYC